MIDASQVDSSLKVNSTLRQATIQHITIKNYGHLGNLSWDMNSKYILLTGPARVGKTTAIEALHIACNTSEFQNNTLCPDTQFPPKLNSKTNIQIHYNIEGQLFLYNLSFNQNKDGDFWVYHDALPHSFRSCMVTQDIPIASPVPDLSFKNEHDEFDYMVSKDITKKALLLVSVSQKHYSVVLLIMKDLYPDIEIKWIIQQKKYENIDLDHYCIQCHCRDRFYALHEESSQLLITLNLLLDIMLQSSNVKIASILDAKNAFKQIPKDVQFMDSLDSPKGGLVMLILVDTFNVHPQLLTPSYWNKISLQFDSCHIIVVAAAACLPNAEALWQWSIYPIRESPCPIIPPFNLSETFDESTNYNLSSNQIIPSEVSQNIMITSSQNHRKRRKRRK